MNTHSIQSSISPFQFLVRKLNQFNRFHTAENHDAHLSKLKKNQPLFMRDPEKIVENHVVNGIEKAMGSDSMTSAKINDQDFTPEKIADRILAFVKKAYGEQQNNDPDFDKANFFKQVKQGIDAGFNSAREELDKLGVLAGQPKDNLNDAYAKIQKGLSRLEVGAQAASVAVSQLQGISAQISQSTEIEIVTKEGDVVKIRLAQSASNSQSAVHLEQEGITANAFQSSSESSSDFTITVEGDLNEDEQKSLKKLLKQMDKVGHDFFNGNIQDAFNHAQKIGLDTEQIASFSMSLSMEKSVQAVAAYQQAAFPEQHIEPDKIKQAADFFSHARDVLSIAQSALEPFENPLSAFNALFEGINQLGVGNSTESKPAGGESSLQQVIKPLGETLLKKDNSDNSVQV